MMQAAYGERTVLGLGRGHTTWMESLGLAKQPGALGKMYSLRAFVDYIDIIRRPWRGATIDYDGPAGRYGSNPTDNTQLINLWRNRLNAQN